MKKNICLFSLLSILTVVLFACAFSQNTIEVPNLNKPGIRKAIEDAAISKAYSLGYRLDSNVRGNLSFTKKVGNNEYYIRVAIGNITDIGGKPGVIVGCKTKDGIINPFVSGTRKKMEEAIKNAAGL